MIYRREDKQGKEKDNLYDDPKDGKEFVFVLRIY